MRKGTGRPADHALPARAFGAKQANGAYFEKGKRTICSDHVLLVSGELGAQWASSSSCLNERDLHVH